MGNKGMTEQELMSLKTRLDVLESENDIRRLKAAYAQGCDDNIGRAIADLFWEDGVWEVYGHFNDKAAGNKAIADMFEAGADMLPFTVHYIMNEAIKVNGDCGTGNWKLLEPCTNKAGDALWIAGRYVDDFERRDGEWRFKHSRLTIDFLTPYENGWSKSRFVDLQVRE